MATKKKYKGKYYGPDIFKGDKGLNTKYESQIKGKGLSDAAKRKIAQQIYGSYNKPAAKPAPKPAPKPATPTTPKPPNVNPNVNPGNVASNASGNVQLQTNHDLNMQELDATNAYNEEVSAANAQQESAAIANKQKQMEFDKQKFVDIGRMNAASAYRGLTGGVAATKKVDLWEGLNEGQTALTSELSQANTSAETRRRSAAARKAAALQQVTLGRQEYTNQQSKNSPTIGSKPEDAGVRPTKPPADYKAPKKPAAKKPVAKKPAAKTSKKYKGKYAGPDVFKGSSKLNAKYKAAIKGKKLSAAARRRLAQQIARGR